MIVLVRHKWMTRSMFTSNCNNCFRLLWNCSDSWIGKKFDDGVGNVEADAEYTMTDDNKRTMGDDGRWRSVMA